MPGEPFPVRWAGRQAVLTLPEHIDATNTGQVREQLLELVNRGAEVLIADMTATVSCDHGGAEALVRAYQRASVNGTQLRVAAVSQLVRRILTINGLDRLVSIYPSLEAALAARAPQTALPARPAQPGPGGSGPPVTAVITPTVLWNLLDALDDGIALVAGDGILALANRRTEDMFGYQHGELVGQSVETLIPAPLRETHIGQRAGYLQQPADRPMGARGRLAGLRKDGTTFPVQVSLSPVPTATGHFTLAVIRDIAGSPPRADLAGLARAIATGQESRGREFLDRVVGSLFRVGLTLQDAESLPHAQAVRRIEAALSQLDDLIREIRDHVFTSDETPPPNGSR